MGRCSYTWEERDFEKHEIVKKQCQKETWKGSDEFCIFHDLSPDKDVNLFKEKLEEQMDSETDKYNFRGYHFPGKWNFFYKEFEIDVNFYNSTFQNANFWGVTFQGFADFREATFQGTEYFKEATFRGNAYFYEATFQDANFSEAKFQDADFRGATFQDADFNNSTFQGTEYFSKATFQGDAYFYKATFQDADFREATFQDADFEGVTFQGTAYFREATFQDADFREATFQDADFSGATFRGNAYFREATFQGTANFWGATFQDADFREATFQDADFWDATFQNADFREATFQGDAGFWGATFQDADFEEATFQDAKFKEATFQNAYFREATFQDADFHNAKVKESFEFNPKKVSGILDFRNAKFFFTGSITVDLERTRFHRAQLQNVTFVDCAWPDNYIIYEEKHMNDEEINLTYNQLETIYRDLKQTMQNHGDYTTAGEFYYREMEMKRKGSDSKKNCIWLELYRLLAGYGEHPQNTAAVSASIVFLFALLYGASNCLQYSIENPCIQQKIIDVTYFSFVTFTTLGLGDIAPATTLGKTLICVEAVIGAFMIALFVVVFVRKMAR